MNDLREYLPQFPHLPQHPTTFMIHNIYEWIFDESDKIILMRRISVIAHRSKIFMNRESGKRINE